jgi:hypothetical protein
LSMCSCTKHVEVHLFGSKVEGLCLLRGGVGTAGLDDQLVPARSQARSVFPVGLDSAFRSRRLGIDRTIFANDLPRLSAVNREVSLWYSDKSLWSTHGPELPLTRAVKLVPPALSTVRPLAVAAAFLEVTEAKH